MNRNLRALSILLPLLLSSCTEMEPRNGARSRSSTIPAPAAPDPRAVIAAEVSALREENQMLRNRVQDIEAQMLTVNQDVSRSRQEQARELQHGQQTVSERVTQLERKLEETERRLAAADQRMAEQDRAQQARMQQMQERILNDISAVLQSPPSRSPGKSGAAAGPGEHVVSSGETLSTIARQHGTSTQRLMEANGITNPNQVRIGQVLKIP